ncbi:MAG: Abi family protein, partial [Clostridia bacterium]|nr:Abi family protein [Clostridia bacterium]
IKSVFAYHFVQNHGVYGYLDKDNFNCASNVNYEDLIDKINKTVKVNTSQEDYLKHFQSIQEPLPFWAYIESFTLSDLSKLYTISKSNVQRAVASEFGLKSNSGYKIMCHYLYCLALLRNICAHGGRLYNRRFNTKPNLNKREKALLKTNDDGTPDNSRLFGYVINIQRLARSLDWNVCKDTILKLCEKYPFVDVSYYGFCEDWHKYM